jgi:hypothetical protein
MTSDLVISAAKYRPENIHQQGNRLERAGSFVQMENATSTRLIPALLPK